jgi:ApbE superfamily uncharacterized protein (UPF0280 family)
MTRLSDFSNRETYRRRVETQLLQWRTAYKDTELFICAETLLETQAWDAVVALRREMDAYIARQPEFLTSLSPIDPLPGAPEMVAAMCRAGRAAGVGPMAAVAGAFAAYVGEALLKYSPRVVVENGGDIWMKTGGQSTAAVYAGHSPLSMKIGITVDASQPISVCTSSGTVGPSLSFGKADAAVIVARDACLADACATRLGNEIQKEEDIAAAVELVCGIPGVIGALAVKGEACGAAGNITLVAL